VCVCVAFIAVLLIEVDKLNQRLTL